MKKIVFSLAVALMCLGFNACEDVPAPYGINTETGGNKDGVTGDGTAENPFSTTAALQYTAALAADVESENDIYIKGKIVSIEEAYNTQYGNGSFTISDDGTAKNSFKVWRALYVGNKKYTAGQPAPKVGDEVVVCGKVVNFKGNTPETVQGKAWIVSLNGTGGGGTGDTGAPQGDGTEANPFNAAGAKAFTSALAADVNSEKDVYIKGKVASIEEAYNTQFGNGSFTISDDGTTKGATFKVWHALYVGNKKYTAGQPALKVGDEVVVCGKVVNFKGNTPETAQGLAWLVSLKSTGGNTGGEVDYTILSVTEAMGITDGRNIFVSGYVVGYVDGKSLTAGLKFTAPTATDYAQTNIVMAASASETDPTKCYPVQLPSGDVRAGLNLAKHPTYIGQKLVVYGQATKYFGVAGLKSTSYAEIAGETYGSKP